MQNQYKIILSNRNLYREAVLNPQAEEIKAGTQTGDDIRLQKDDFFEPIELVFLNKGEQWTLLTADNLYISEGERDIRKLRSRDLVHGDVVEIRYQESDNMVFRLEFSIDFDEGSHQFNRYADLKGFDRVSIGAGSENNIILQSVYTGNDQIELYRSGNGFRLHILHAAYGVLHNGKKAEDGEQINDRDFFSISDCYFYLRKNHLWTEKSSQIKFSGLQILRCG